MSPKLAIISSLRKGASDQMIKDKELKLYKAETIILEPKWERDTGGPGIRDQKSCAKTGARIEKGDETKASAKVREALKVVGIRCTTSPSGCPRFASVLRPQRCQHFETWLVSVNMELFTEHLRN